MDKKIQEELLNKTGDFINQAAHTLGQTAVHVYQVLVKQQFVEGIGTILGFGLWTLVFGISLKIYVSFCKKNWKKADSDEEFGMIMGGAIGFLIFGIILGVVTAYMSGAVQKMINPEFYAIKFIFESVSGK